MSHLPPIDLRYGWYIGRRPDQILLLYGILCIGVTCLFAAPNCALWGNMTRNLPRDALLTLREQEHPTLTFIAMLCFLQHLMGRMFMVETSGASVIFEESPLAILEQLGLYSNLLDQCMYGAQQENQPIRKNTKVKSDKPI